MPINKKLLNILLISTSYPLDKNDWRGIFIKDMLYSLANKNNISLSIWAPPGIIHNQVKYAATHNQKLWLHSLMEKGGIAHILRKKNFSSLTETLKLLFFLKQVYKHHQSTEIFHINWLQNVIPLWNTKQPILVTVLGTDMKMLKIPGMIQILRKIFMHRRTIIAPNANWMVEKLEQHFSDLVEVRAIPFGINTQWYHLNIYYNETSSRKWLVVLRLTKKKIGYLFQWGGGIFNNNDELHLFGPNQDNLVIPSWVYYHGSTTPEALQKEWFPNAAGLISLSQHDEGRPQVMLEAMAAGLPIIASPIKAHSDFITHKETGWIVDSQEKFSQGIRWLSLRSNNEYISKQAKSWVKNQLGTWNDCADRYLAAYHNLLEKNE